MKALILSTATGGGHNTAAHAVLEALTERGVECRFEDCVAFGGQKLSATVSNVYVKFVQAAPDAFGRLYRFAKAISTPRIKSPVYLFNAAYARKMEQLLTDYAPDLIVCTHMFGGQSVTYLRRHDLWNGLFAMVMTDYTIHPFIEDIECDVMFTCKAAMPSARRLALPKSAYEFTGIPVSLSCRPCTDKRAAKEAVGLDPERPEVVLVGGRLTEYADVDMNRHMNNTHYPDILCGYIPEISGNRVISMTLNFVNEAPLGERIKIYSGKSDGSYYFRTKRPDGKVNVEAEFILEEI